ncbi:helix-turn-helix domain-containing protein [Rhodoferax sp. U2-2l]|uniref:helix-turn-helix domain-containing protein n=1 Tax=Rhodoferax sp. U2-2l TaxID=2884000 RepID=UPI001D0AACE9|nr:helix-turn-helix transcriptional regulator [Rhodoferax sp. U2-2l]MCB8749032.1 helix-turn-helix domain-containing protein [Rhodoferax sp. U2-2l]
MNINLFTDLETNFFGTYLVKVRRAKRLMQKQVAIDAGLDASYLAALERGRRLPPRAEVMKKLFLALEANENEQSEMKYAASLSRMSNELVGNAINFPGVEVALAVLEAAGRMTPEELAALATMIHSLGSRQVPLIGRSNMG